MKVKIGDFLKRIKRPIQIDDNQKYKLVTVKLKHKGVVLREEKLGKDIGSNMFVVHKGDFILSGIDARNGAFGIVPDQLDGAIVTNDFWYFSIDESIISKELFLKLTATQWFDDICKKGSDGTTQRIRLQKDKFFEQEIDLPAIELQANILQRIENVEIKTNKINQELDQQSDLLSKLRQSILNDAISGKLTEKWRLENPNTETGADLLARIKAEKHRLIAEKKIPKEKPLPPISEDEIPFDLPEGWVWCRLGEIAELKSGQDLSPNEYSNNDQTGIPYLTGASNFENEKIIINRWTQKPTSKSIFGDLLLTCKGSGIGKMAWNDIGEVHIARQIMAIHPCFSFFNIHFIKYILDLKIDYFRENAKSLIPGIDRAIVLNTILSLPNSIEQQVIVDSIEKKMLTIKEVEDQVTERKEQTVQMMQAVLRGAFEE